MGAVCERVDQSGGRCAAICQSIPVASVDHVRERTAGDGTPVAGIGTGVGNVYVLGNSLVSLFFENLSNFDLMAFCWHFLAFPGFA